MHVVGVLTDDTPSPVKMTVMRDPEHKRWEEDPDPSDALVLMFEFENGRTSSWNIDVKSGGVAGGSSIPAEELAEFLGDIDRMNEEEDYGEN